MTSISLLLANEMHDIFASKCFFFGDLRLLVRKFASPFGHPTQDASSTCGYLRVRLIRALKFLEGLKVKMSNQLNANACQLFSN